jgi:hypothetical protein
MMNDGNVRLRRLWLTDRLCESDLEPLNQYLAQTTTLRDLRIVSLLTTSCTATDPAISGIVTRHVVSPNAPQPTATTYS